MVSTKSTHPRVIRGGPVNGLVRLARPKQWSKNVLVAAAPLAADQLFTLSVVGTTIAAFVCFCLAASSVYMINDVLDVAADRAHLQKRYRPVAAGTVSARAAVICAVICAAASLAIPLALANPNLALVLLAYLALQAAYVWKLKHEAVFDIATIASGFLLRAIAGGVAASIPISHAFLIVVSFGALFMAVCKRYSEIINHDQTNGNTRKSLAQYTPSYLRILLAVSGTITLVGYVMWAFELNTRQPQGPPYAVISIIPFTLAVMRYIKDADSANVEAPEDALLADNGLLVLGLIWLALFVAQVTQFGGYRQ